MKFVLDVYVGMKWTLSLYWSINKARKSKLVKVKEPTSLPA